MAAFARLRDFTCTADCPICGGIGQGAANALAANGIEAVGAGGARRPPRKLGGSPGRWSQRTSGSVSAGVSKAAIMICLGELQRDGAAVNDADRVDESSEAHAPGWRREQVDYGGGKVTIVAR
jgi:hypothetical protein